MTELMPLVKSNPHMSAQGMRNWLVLAWKQWWRKQKTTSLCAIIARRCYLPQSSLKRLHSQPLKWQRASAAHMSTCMCIWLSHTYIWKYLPKYMHIHIYVYTCGYTKKVHRRTHTHTHTWAHFLWHVQAYSYKACMRRLRSQAVLHSRCFILRIGKDLSAQSGHWLAWRVAMKKRLLCVCVWCWVCVFVQDVYICTKPLT